MICWGGMKANWESVERAEKSGEIRWRSIRGEGWGATGGWRTGERGAEVGNEAHVPPTLAVSAAEALRRLRLEAPELVRAADEVELAVRIRPHWRRGTAFWSTRFRPRV